eukprot:scaffold149_cov315-Pinguiococcus_pyrenoidosus.AAC.97
MRGCFMRASRGFGAGARCRAWAMAWECRALRALASPVLSFVEVRELRIQASCKPTFFSHGFRVLIARCFILNPLTP